MKMLDHWYQSRITWLGAILLPLSWLFYVIVKIRYWCYQIKIKQSYRMPVPVIVVGNITVGGTGKTPLVIWLANFLREKGYQPGVVSRGVGGIKHAMPQLVLSSSDVADVGDEAMLLAKNAGCPVVIAIDRVAAAQELLKNHDCNIIISDDGLQHYRLQRDLEIVVVDKMRGFGNKQLLPAGPLREPLTRLQQVNIVAYNGSDLQLHGDTLVSVRDDNKTLPLTSLRNASVHAVAAIGNPKRFFTLLRQFGLTVIEHIFPDHYHYQKKDIHFEDNLSIIMTEKDAVKCHQFANEQAWYLPVNVTLDPLWQASLWKKIQEKCR